jgi:hypothetical protein
MLFEKSWQCLTLRAQRRTFQPPAGATTDETEKAPKCNHTLKNPFDQQVGWNPLLGAFPCYENALAIHR